MANAPSGFKVRLLPEDEYTHSPDKASNYNESMYFNMFDPERKTGGWFRLGNRPNENYAEMSVCLYLPDGRVAFMFQRPSISHNDAMDAGGMRIDVVEPFKTLRLTYEGEALILSDPLQMATPKEAFKSNPRKPCKVDLTYTGESPMYGGEMVKADGSPIEIDPEKSFAKAHYEQHCSVKGTITVDGETLDLSGHGLRDKSWGPRHWQAIEWYRCSRSWATGRAARVPAAWCSAMASMTMSRLASCRANGTRTTTRRRSGQRSRPKPGRVMISKERFFL